MEWMKLEAPGHHGPESKWGSDEKKRPEYDLEIVVLGDKSDQPQSERFTLRAGSTCALEMYRRYVRIDSPVNQAVVNQRKCRVQGSVGIPHSRVQLFVYVGGQWHQNGDATVRGNSWEGICWFGDKDATRGEYRIRAIADGDLEPIKYKELPNNGVRSEDISVHLKREKTT